MPRPDGLTAAKEARYPPYSRTDSTKSPASGAGKVRERGLMLQAGRARASRVSVDQGAFAVRAVEVPVLVCLRSSYCHVTDMGWLQG